MLCTNSLSYGVSLSLPDFIFITLPFLNLAKGFTICFYAQSTSFSSICSQTSGHPSILTLPRAFIIVEIHNGKIDGDMWCHPGATNIDIKLESGSKQHQGLNKNENYLVSVFY